MTTALANRATKRAAPAAGGQRDALAESAYRQGLEAARQERWERAARAFSRAAARVPGDAVFWLNLADARLKLGEPDRAVQAAQRAVEAARQAADGSTGSEHAIAIAAQCTAIANRHEETVELLRRLDLDSVQDVIPHFTLGNALTELHRHREAIDAYLAALRRKPDYMPAHAQLGNVFEREKMHLEARECFRTAMMLGGDRVTLLSAMTYHAQHACRWDLLAEDLAELRRALAGGAGQCVPFHLLTLPSTRAEQLAAGRAFFAARWGNIRPLPAAAPRKAGARIRIGYATSDVFRHATAYLIADLIETHDRSRFDVFLYSYGHDDGSPIRQRIVAAAGDGFVEASRMTDAELAERVRRDDIDILVDLKGYTQGTRVGLFALHPARVQVNYLGYPGTLGAPCYEYIIGDPVVTPLEHADGYSEKIAQLPNCYQPNDRRRPIGPNPGRPACGLPERGFVFCSFNTCYKITGAVFDRWCRLLQQVPGSVLWLYQANEQARLNLTAEAGRRGIAAERLVWAPHADLAEHLGRLQLADLVLDTFPVTAHTTASDALWAGVPMITMAGETFVSRVAGSVLRAAGLPEAIAADGTAYERTALQLARDPAALAALRERLARNRGGCALFDCAAYARDLESLYERMIAAWSAGRAPQHLPAPAP